MKSSFKHLFTVDRALIFFFLLLFLVPTSFFLSKFYLFASHTLENNQNWKSAKVELQKGVIGGVAYFITPIALMKNRLNLEGWLGYQEVLYKNAIDPQKVSFDFDLPFGSYFSFIYNKTPTQFSGIRFSRSPFYQTILFTADSKGKFLKKESVEVKNIRDSNHLKILFYENGLSLFLNGELLKSIRENLPPTFSIGFRGGIDPASIDNFRIVLKSSGRIIKDDFSNRQSILFPFLISLTFLSFINLIIYLKQKRKMDQNPKAKPIYFLLTANFIFFFFGIILWVAQTSYLSRNYYFPKYYFKIAAFLRNYQTTIESKNEVIDRLRRSYVFGPSPNSFRVLFIGTSQTWGAGARTEEETFVRQLEKKINEENPHKINYEFINGGISGEGSGRLWKPYEKEWIQLNPKVTLIDLSNNDVYPHEFSEHLEKYIRLNESKGIRTVLVLEANAIDQVRSYFAENHQIMRSLAKKYDLPLIDLHHCLLGQYDSGFLWWDFVHPTSYGHQLAAECIYPTLANVIQKETK